MTGESPALTWQRRADLLMMDPVSVAQGQTGRAGVATQSAADGVGEGDAPQCCVCLQMKYGRKKRCFSLGFCSDPAGRSNHYRQPRDQRTNGRVTPGGGELHLSRLRSDRLNWWGVVALQVKLTGWHSGVTSPDHQGETNAHLVIKLLLTGNVDAPAAEMASCCFRETTDTKAP